MPFGDLRTDDFYWDDTLGWVLKQPLAQYVMPPTPTWEREAASIICGHDYIQRMPEGEQAEFETFVREVIRTQQR